MNKQEYHKYLMSDYWKEFSRQVKDIFGNKCWFCGSIKHLNLHHTRYYKNTFFSNRKVINNLRWFLVICKDCHTKIHDISKDEKLEPYKATKEFRNRFYSHKKIYLTKRKAKGNIS